MTYEGVPSFVWGILTLFAAFCVFAFLRWQKQRGPTAEEAATLVPDDDEDDEPEEYPPERVARCKVCCEAPATHTKPHAVYSRKNAHRDRHASHAYGIPPRPHVSTKQEAHRPRELCLGCLNLCTAELEAFLSDHHGQLTRLASTQAREAAAFEARGMFEAVRKQLRGDE